MNMTKERRQQTIDEYLSDTGANMVIGSEFIEWIAARPEHPAHAYFCGMSQDDMVREYQLVLFRRFIGGLDLRVRYAQPERREVNIQAVRSPAYISPRKFRDMGGGYVRFEPDDPELVSELRRQGVVALNSWLARYAVAFTDSEIAAIRSVAEADTESLMVAAEQAVEARHGQLRHGLARQGKAVEARRGAAGRGGARQLRHGEAGHGVDW